MPDQLTVGTGSETAVSAASASSATRRELRLPVVAVAALVLVAAVAGLVLGGVFHGKPAAPAKPRPATVVSSAGVRLQLPSGWVRRGAGSLPGFDRPLWLRDAPAGVRAAVELLPAGSPTLLPVGLQASGAPAMVALGQGRRAWRYGVVRSDSVPLAVYAVPTTKGVATVGCLGSGRPAERACQALATALTAPGARQLDPGANAAFLIRLPATVAVLDTARAKGTHALKQARRPAAQAAAADGLARAHRTAAAELAPLRSGDEPASKTVKDLRAAASAYSALADAARARAPRPYAQARHAVLSADRELRGTLARAATP